jgi:hypothetical protein
VGANVKTIHIPFLKAADGDRLEQYSSLMDYLPRDHVLANNWPEYRTESSAVFKVAHNDAAILVKFYIRDDYFQAVERPVNSAVHKDNCVEFFVCFAPCGPYYNIEFNCLGVGKVAYGTSRVERSLLPEACVKQIGILSRVGTTRPVFDWEILLYIPVSIFGFDEITSLSGVRCEANFYVCGDERPEPHYLVWNPVASAEPDFHRPEYFGDIVFCEASAL